MKRTLATVVVLVFCFMLTPAVSRVMAQSSQTFYVKAKLSPDNEVPNPGINASGTARARITVNRDAAGAITSGVVTFDVGYMFPGAVTLTGFHIHTGALGENGGVVINSGLASTPDSDGAGSFTFTTPSLSTAGQLTALNGLVATPHLYYMNLHTTVFPGGVIRGQCTSETYFYKANLSPANEVPAIAGSTASASVLVTLDITRDSSGNITSGAVLFDASYLFPGGTTFSGFHIHTGRAGENGGIVINPGPTSIVVDATGAGRITKAISLPTTQAVLDALKAVITNPAGHYVNLHTTVSPGGAARGQLVEANQSSSIPYALDDGIFRSNLGIQNLTNLPGLVVVSLAGETGTGSALSVHVPARGFVQLPNVNNLLGVGPLGVARLDTDQHVEAFVSTIENATNTPYVIPMMSKGTRLAVAAVTNLGGRYVSSLVVSNEGRAAAMVDILARDISGAVSGQLTGVTIPAGGFFYRADILTTLGISSGYGPLEIRSTNGQPVSALSLVVNASNNRGSVMAGKEF